MKVSVRKNNLRQQHGSILTVHFLLDTSVNVTFSSKRKQTKNRCTNAHYLIRLFPKKPPPHTFFFLPLPLRTPCRRSPTPPPPPFCQINCYVTYFPFCTISVMFRYYCLNVSDLLWGIQYQRKHGVYNKGRTVVQSALN